jgi:hypothetical protein
MMVDQQKGAKADRKSVIARLRELIGALDRRMPRPERTGESQIANEAAALKDKALARIAQLEMRACD